MRRWPLLCFCFLICLLAFGRGLDGAFLNFDDPLTVLGNPAFQAGFPDGLPRILDPRATIADVYLPVSYLSLWADWGLFGSALPAGYHIHSLVLHGLAGFVLVLLLLDLGFSRTIAGCAATVFLAHPALTESVSWISSRKDVLSGLFVLLALWLGRRASRGGGHPWLVLGCVLLACYSKGTALVLPLLALLLWRGPDVSPTRFWKLLGATTAIVLVTGVHHSVLAMAGGTTDFPSDVRAVPGAFVHYLSVLAWPSSLAVHYPRATGLATFADGAGAKALWLLVLVAAGFVVELRAHGPLRWVGTGILVVLAALLPFNTFAPASAVAAADRYLYLAVPGVALVVAGLVASVPARLRQLGPVVAGALLLAALVPLAWGRAADFRRSDRLWEANLAVFPRDAVALTNLAEWHLSDPAGGGVAQARPLLLRAMAATAEPVFLLRISGQLLRCALARGDLDEVVDRSQEAIELADGLPVRFVRQRVDWRLQLTDALERLGRFTEAGQVLDSVLALEPDHPDALGSKALHVLREVARGAEKLPLDAGDARLAPAAELLARAEADPRARQSVRWVVASSELCRLRGETTRAAATLAEYRGPPHEELVLQAAAIYQAEGMLPEAIRELERGHETVRVSLRLPLMLGRLYLLADRREEAAALLRRVHESFPDHAEARRLYAHGLVAQARAMVGVHPAKDWAPLVRKAKELAPDIPALAYLEAVVLQAERRLGAALQRARAAATSSPDDPQVRDLLLELLKQSGTYALLQQSREEAFRYFREFLDVLPAGHDPGAVLEIMRGECERRLEEATQALFSDDLVRAEAGFRSALELFPDHDGALLKLGMALFGAGRYAEAEASLARSMEQAERRGADPGMALLYRMRALVELGRPREALQLAQPYLSGAEQKKLQDERTRVRITDLAEKLRAD